MEAVFIPASRRGATQSRGNLSYGWHLYRHQKELAGGKFRLKCAKGGRNFKSAGFALRYGSGAGAAVLRFGRRESRCEPIASVSGVDRILRISWPTHAASAERRRCSMMPIVWKVGPPDISHSLPPMASIKRSVQNA